MTKRLNINDPAPGLTLENSKGETVSLDDFAGAPVALLFMRYVGCPVCQMETIEYKQQYETLKNAGLELLMVFQSSVDNLQHYAVEEVLPFVALSDPTGRSYKEYGANSGLTGFLAPSNLSPILKSFRSGHRHGKFEGNEFQYPAAFIIDEERRVRFIHYGKTVSDGIRPETLLNAFAALNR